MEASDLHDVGVLVVELEGGLAQRQAVREVRGGLVGVEHVRTRHFLQRKLARPRSCPRPVTAALHTRTCHQWPPGDSTYMHAGRVGVGGRKQGPVFSIVGRRHAAAPPAAIPRRDLFHWHKRLLAYT